MIRNPDGESAPELDPTLMDQWHRGELSRAEAVALQRLQTSPTDGGEAKEGDQIIMTPFNDPLSPINQAEREVANLLNTLLEGNPLPPPPKPKKPLRSEGIYQVTDPEALALDCVAIIRDGQITPLTDLSHLPEVPQTFVGKIRLMNLTIKAMMERVTEALDFWEFRLQQRAEDQDGDEGGCRV